MPTCNICRDNKRIRLPTYSDLNACDQFDEGFNMPEAADAGWKEFDCPQCVPMVPYRRIRATKIATAYQAAEFGKYQMPIERGLAARFGEHLLREGLIRFTTDSLNNYNNEKVTITAHCAVVSPEDTRKAGTVEEVATVPAPPLPKKLTRQERERITGISPRAVKWEPPKAPWSEPDEDVTDEFAEPKDAIANRFSGLEI